jgi:hypothetical protein
MQRKTMHEGSGFLFLSHGACMCTHPCTQRDRERVGGREGERREKMEKTLKSSKMKVKITRNEDGENL